LFEILCLLLFGYGIHLQTFLKSSIKSLHFKKHQFQAEHGGTHQ
jgi:hypothetical protein